MSTNDSLACLCHNTLYYNVSIPSTLIIILMHNSHITFQQTMFENVTSDCHGSIHILTQMTHIPHENVGARVTFTCFHY